MSRRLRDLLIGVALALVALGGALWQVEASQAQAEDERQSLPRLVCPLH
jgi:hypothetical protein